MTKHIYLPFASILTHTHTHTHTHTVNTGQHFGWEEGEPDVFLSRGPLSIQSYPQFYCAHLGTALPMPWTNSNKKRQLKTFKFNSELASLSSEEKKKKTACISFPS